MKRTWGKLILAIALIAATLLSSIEPQAQVFFTDPQIVACGSPPPNGQPAEIVREIRQAASLAANLDKTSAVIDEFSSMFTDEIFSSQFFTNPRSVSLAELRSVEQILTQRIGEFETIARGTNRECREIVGHSTFSDPVLYSMITNVLDIEMKSPLAQLYLYQNLARAMIVLRATDVNLEENFRDKLSSELLEQTQILAQSIGSTQSNEIALAKSSVLFMPIFFGLAIAEDEELSIEVLNPSHWEKLACGERIDVPYFNIALDGGLVITEGNGTIRYPLRQTGAELWALTNTMINIILILFNPSYGISYLDTAISGCSTELRHSAANLYLSLNPEVSTDPVQLEELVMSGRSDELKWAAAAYLSPLLARDVSKTDADLQAIARLSNVEMMRSAAGYALGLRWMRRVEGGSINYQSTFEYPPNGGINRQSGTLTQYALAHAGIHPQLAQATILPLFTAFNMAETTRP